MSEGMNSSFQILLSKRSSLAVELDNLAKRAARKGLPFPALSWGQAYQDSKGVARIALSVEGEAVGFSGWSFVAVLQHLEGGTVVRGVVGAEVPVMYRSRGSVCDHCETSRSRIDTYLLVKDGVYKQVGSSCLQDFSGSNAVFELASAAEVSSVFRSLCEESESGFGGDGGVRFLPSYLANVAAAIRLRGWVSRKAADEKGGASTSDLAWDNNFDPSKADVALGVASVAWAESLSDETLQSQSGDYLHNLRVVARSGYADFRTRGIAASLVVAYEREQERIARASRPVSKTYLGKVGEKLSVKAVLEFVAAFEHQYGVTTVLKFRSESGETLVWKASNPKIGREQVGQAFTVTGTVKAHETYREEAQTVLTRCKTV